MYNLLIGNYNNYFNRIVKREETDFRYFTVMGNTFIIKNINFNPNDGISTQVILGKGDFLLPESTTRPIQPDYAILYTTELENPPYTDAKIVSKWFVIEAVRTRSGQYQLTLKRDVLAEHYSNIMNAPCFVEKGIISNADNPLLFNNEGMTYNQIKKEEIPLKDETGCGWVVGYIPSNSFEDPNPDPIEKDVILSTSNADIEVNGLSTWSYWQYVTTNPSYTRATSVSDFAPKTSVKYKYKYIQYQDGPGGSTMTLTFPRANQYSFTKNQPSGETVNIESSTNPNPSWWNNYSLQTKDDSGYVGPVSRVFSNIYNNSTYIGYLQALLNNEQAYSFENASTINNIRALRSKIIYDSTNGNYYRIDIVERTEDRTVALDADSSSYKTNILNFINSNVLRTGGSFDNFVINNTNVTNNGNVEIYFNNTYYAIDLTQISVPCKVTINNDRFHLEDSPYDMFCIPYSDTLQLSYNSGGEQVTFTCKKAVALAMASAIGEKSGSKNIYDVQLLPYCPARHVIAGSPDPGTTLVLDTTEYDLITHNDTPISAVIWCMSSSFQVPINQNISLLNIKGPFSTVSGTLKTDKYYTIQYSTDPSSSTTLDAPMTLVWTNKITGEFIKSEEITSIAIAHSNIGILHVGDITYVRASDPVINVIRKAQYLGSDYYLSIKINGTYTNTNFVNYLVVPTASDPNSPVSIKMSNECDLYRLCSGNYNGIFEFSAAKSYGVNGFIAECTYKPYSPYIHVTPVLKGLYELSDGTSYRNIDDSRGLICGGEFSLPQVSNEWANYELNNKNYQKMFDRQIQNIDTNNAIAKEQLDWQGGVAALTGGIGGASAGAIAGYKATNSPYGAAAGAMIGGFGGVLLSGIGYEKDKDWLARQQAETKNYAIDMFNYQLGNIKAIPNSLSKSSAITWNTRVWPFVEHYTCTDTEKQALREKLKYNGMTIMKIDNLINYSTSTDFDRVYVKGQLINLEGINDDFHTADAIYAEVNKGFYILQ